MFMSKIKILLTGGSGFIGKNVLEILGDKYNFLYPDRRELDLVDFFSVQQYLMDNRPNIIIHLATVGGNRRIKDQNDILRKNLIMFYNLCSAKKYFTRMIVAGSGAEYDKSRNIFKIKEDNFGERVPVDEYSLSKYTMGKYAECNNFITHLRFFGVYGKHEDYQTRFISNNICKAMFDLPLTINQNTYFDYLYVNDLVKILDFFIKNDRLKYNHYNVCTGQKVDLLSLANKIRNYSSKDLEIRIAKKGLNKEYTGDNTRLIEEVKDLEFTPIDKSVQELYDWYNSNINKMNKGALLEN